MERPVTLASLIRARGCEGEFCVVHRVDAERPVELVVGAGVSDLGVDRVELRGGSLLLACSCVVVVKYGHRWRHRYQYRGSAWPVRFLVVAPVAGADVPAGAADVPAVGAPPPPPGTLPRVAVEITGCRAGPVGASGMAGPAPCMAEVELFGEFRVEGAELVAWPPPGLAL